MTTISKTTVINVGGVDFAVDACNLEKLNAYKWNLFDTGRGHRYAQTNIRRADGRQVKLRMHRFLLGLDFDDVRVVDHINRDTTDNRVANLRAVSYVENNINCSRKYGGPLKAKNGWIVRPRINGKPMYGGFFLSHDEAVSAFNRITGVSNV